MPLFLALVAASSLHASGDFAHCSLAGDQLKRLNDYVQTDLRVRAAQTLMLDLDLLRPQLEHNTTGLPNKLIKLCFDLKRQAFEATFVKASADLYGYYDFLITAGRYFFYERTWEASYRAFEAAAKMQPRLLDPNHYALQAWIMFQLGSDRPVSQENYLRISRDYISHMLHASDVTFEQRRDITAYLGTLEERSSKIYTARRVYETSTGLDPDNLKTRLAWGEFEERVGQFENAIKVYEGGFSVKSTDENARKELYLRALGMYRLTGAKKKYDQRMKEALAAFPNDAAIVKFNKDRSMLANPKLQEIRMPASVKSDLKEPPTAAPEVSPKAKSKTAPPTVK